MRWCRLKQLRQRRKSAYHSVIHCICQQFRHCNLIDLAGRRKFEEDGKMQQMEAVVAGMAGVRIKCRERGTGSRSDS